MYGVEVLSSSIELGVQEHSRDDEVDVQLGVVSRDWVLSNSNQEPLTLEQSNHGKDEGDHSYYPATVEEDTALAHVATSERLRD